MRTSDIIRAVLDLLDSEDQKPTVNVDIQNADSDEESRFRQIFAMLDKDKPFPGTGATTEPNEIVAPVSSVTTDAGGGINGPKHPDDIRVKDPSAYSNQQEY